MLYMILFYNNKNESTYYSQLIKLTIIYFYAIINNL